MSRATSEYVRKDYGRKSTFASFLPGIAGEKGIPIWCYYVNRGQAVVSFGVDNKDHAIMEFYPAHMAYQNVKRTGFRTFIRRDGVFYEPFSDETMQQDMYIQMNGLGIVEKNSVSGLTTSVDYYTLPEEHVGALVRKVTIRNTADKPCHLEVLDGMPAIIPYGVGMDSMKNMTQTAKAWMQVEDHKTGVPYFRVRASMEDSSSVKAIEGGNFAFAVMEDGTSLPAVVDPEVVFGYDSSLEKPVNFMQDGLNEICSQTQIVSNKLPCSFFALEKELAANECVIFYEMIGQVSGKQLLHTFLKKKLDCFYFERKKERAAELAEQICAGIETETADERFDAYCKYTYMDNVLRGGLPIKLGNSKIFYVYSRKHGDLERDYNYFSMSPEFYSQGNGNFRDVNQNRRCDTFFAPFVGRENIHTFYSLIQMDGYNPLGIERLTYSLDREKAKLLLKELNAKQQEAILAVVERAFTPGKLYEILLEQVDPDKAEGLFISILDFADGLVNGNFGEGYWSDHWTYNLDLIEDYLSVFPEKEKDMLFEQAYSYFISQINVNPRFKRYEVTEKGVRQYHALDEASARHTADKLLRADYGRGEVIYSTLFEKLLLLCATKFATLDPYGMGIEMEGGKPGWYDALNGMPGLLGSSMAETCELARMISYTADALEKYPSTHALLADLGTFIEQLHAINQAEKKSVQNDMELLSFWNRINDAKEEYRRLTYGGIDGARKEYSSVYLLEVLRGFAETIACGIKKACTYGDGICPTYFTFEVKKYEQRENEIIPLKFEAQKVPYFLEGPVRYLKLNDDFFCGQAPITRQKLYENVKHSDLYDEKLSMYKVNASLADASYELGRARAFTPGWLENESIWLHMEYKYLLELLKSGMYTEFSADFRKAAVPFLDEEVYGRSTLENSSFIASSKNPDPKIHGKGFVARLSGSTIEFISMWKLMMFGPHPFYQENGALCLSFAPAIPQYLIGKNQRVSAKFLGHIWVTYYMKEQKDYFPGQYHIPEVTLTYLDGSIKTVREAKLQQELALDVRDGRVSRIEVTLN
ncbi:MAG: hypothetical protein MR016_03685 [Agathobacter sp.]|nr:hypothetical protein [Agathobacter sp.]